MDDFRRDSLILFPAWPGEQPNSTALLVHRLEENLLAVHLLILRFSSCSNI